MRIVIALAFVALTLLSGCQAPLQIVPSTMTPTPTGQPGLEPLPAATAAAVAAAGTSTAVATPTSALASPTPTASASPAAATASPTASPTPTTTATRPASATPTLRVSVGTASSTPKATLRSGSGQVQPTNTATVSDGTSPPTRTPTALARVPRLTPTPTRRLPTATRRPFTSTPTRTRQLPTATRRPPTRTPTPARVNIELTEAQLNKSVRDAIAKDPSTPVRSISIDTQPGKVLISAQARLGFFNVNVEITVIVDVRNGNATPVIQEIKVNGRPATGIVRQQVEAAVQPYLNQIAGSSKNIYVESVTITDSGLKIQGRPK